MFARLLCWILAVVAAVPLFGLVDLSTMFGLADPQFVWSVPLEVSWGALLTFVIALAFANLGTRPGAAHAPLALLAPVPVALAIAAVGYADPGPLLIGAPLAVAIVAVALLLRTPMSRATTASWRLSVRRGALAAIGVVVWVAYAVLTHRQHAVYTGSDDERTLGIDHWPVQSALGLTMAASAVIFAGWSRGRALWPISAGLTTGFVATACLLYSDRPGAMPTSAWPIIALVWVIALVVDAVFADRRRPQAAATDVAT